MGSWFSKSGEETEGKKEESKNKESDLENEVKHLKKRIENQDQEIKKNKNDISKNSSEINKINKTLEEHGERLDNNDKWFKQLVSLSEKMDKRIEVTEETCKGTQKTLNNSMNILDIHRKMLFPSQNDLKTPLSSRNKQIENFNLETDAKSVNQEAPIPAMITDNNLNDKCNEL